VAGTGRAASTKIAHDNAWGCESAQVPTLPLQSPAQPNLGSDTNCQDQPSALLPINHTVGSFADHLRGDVRNACSHSSPVVALLNQNELARRTMNVVWVVLRSTSFCFFHYIWGRREYMAALRPQRPSRPPPSPCSRTTQCRTTWTQRHDAHAVRAQSASCSSGQTPRLTLYLAGKKETKNYKHLGTELLDSGRARCCTP
jgi:hypothetical protein